MPSVRHPTEVRLSIKTMFERPIGAFGDGGTLLFLHDFSMNRGHIHANQEIKHRLRSG